MQTPGTRRLRRLFVKRLRVLRVAFFVVMAGCNRQPDSWSALQKHVAGIDAPQKDAAIEKFIADKHGTPIVENQTRLIFLVKDSNGRTPRVVGDVNNWAVTQQGYDAAV